MSKDMRFLVGALAIVAGSSTIMGTTIQVVEAKAPNALKDVNTKLTGLTSSIKKNYLGLKNIVKWKKDLNIIKGQINKLPKGQAKDKMIARAAKVETLLASVSGVSSIEYSLSKNANIIKNVKGWEVAIENSKKSLAKVDHKEFKKEHATLLERLAKVNAKVSDIKTKYFAKVGEINSTYNKAIELSKTQKDRALAMLKFCLEEANKLNSHPVKDGLIAKINKAIEEVNKIPSVDPFIKDDKGNITVKDGVASVDITEASIGAKNIKKLTLPYAAAARISGINVETVVIKGKLATGPADEKAGGLYVSTANVTTIISTEAVNLVIGEKTRVETAVLIGGGNLMIMPTGGIFNLEMHRATKINQEGFIGNLVSTITSTEKVVVKQGAGAMILKAIYAKGYDNIEGVTNKVEGAKVVLPAEQYKNFTVVTTSYSAAGASFHVKPVAGLTVSEVRVNGVVMEKDPQRGSYKMPALTGQQTEYVIEVKTTPEVGVVRTN
ncbi:MAG: hypothetical protein RR898_08670 [Clostridium sp.]|uniref:hypothetical protein n=1 Tax=Clostridium sp. TaxID=1506 RepID=UPI002FC6A058